MDETKEEESIHSGASKLESLPSVQSEAIHIVSHLYLVSLCPIRHCFLYK